MAGISLYAYHRLYGVGLRSMLLVRPEELRSSFRRGRQALSRAGRR